MSQDPYGARLQAAIWEDVFAAFPQADGGIMDGWTESPYELDFHHGHAVFRELRENEREAAEVRGWDTARLDAGREHLRRRFHSFTSKMVGYYGVHGFLQGINLFDLNEDALYWLRWRRDDGLAVGRAFRSELDQLSSKLLLGNGLRSAVFSGMTAVDFTGGMKSSTSSWSNITSGIAATTASTAPSPAGCSRSASGIRVCRNRTVLSWPALGWVSIFPTWNHWLTWSSDFPWRSSTRS